MSISRTCDPGRKNAILTILCLTVLLKKMSVDVTYKEKNNLTICSKFVLVTLNEVITVRYQFSCDEKVIHTKYVHTINSKFMLWQNKRACFVTQPKSPP
jgi:hypothetical protein